MKHTRLLKLNVLSPKNSYLWQLPLLISVLLISGCATLFGQNDREIHIASVPNGANVYMGGINYGKTPMALVLPKVGYTGQTITLVKPGFKQESFQVQTEFQNVGYWNLIVFPSFLFDLGTGYMFKLKPDSYNFSIQLESSVAIKESHESQLIQITPVTNLKMEESK